MNLPRLPLLAVPVAASLAAGCVVEHQVPPYAARPVAVDHGRIVAVEQVQRPSTASQEGAVVGGFLGFLLSGRSLPEKVFGTAVGAAAGSAIAEENAGPRQGFVYTVRAADGRTQRVMTERPDLRPGDCVAVETARWVNLRRVPDDDCEPPSYARAPAPAPTAAPEREPASPLPGQERAEEERARDEAARCDDAKEELSRAKTREETEGAIQRVRDLCDR